MEKLLRTTAAGIAFGLALGAPLGAAAKSSDHRTFDGTVVHISGDNIKVKGTEGGKQQILSFLYVPRIGKVAHSGGQVTKTQEKLHVGEYVRVTYDQKLLGVRHVDSIMARSVGKMKM
ncbi:MAG: hypothetical protein M3R53_01800 [Candidatus Eremiobacteraeota bacterium]|nr:hypothetical protein [Candidatus Eremiobacteraeota bacterium]